MDVPVSQSVDTTIDLSAVRSTQRLAARRLRSAICRLLAIDCMFEDASSGKLQEP